VRSELKPEVVLATIIDPKGENSLKMPIMGWDCLAYKSYWATGSEIIFCSFEGQITHPEVEI